MRSFPYKESQNIFKQIEEERMRFNGLLDGALYPSPEEAWRWESLNVKIEWNKDVNIETWLSSFTVKVKRLEDIQNITSQFPEDEVDTEGYE